MNLGRFIPRIASWNAKGVSSRKIEPQDFINKHSLDIILIQQTHLRPGVNFKIPNFTTFRNGRIPIPTHPSGGTAILIKSSLKHHHIPTPSLGAVEATAVVLTPPPDDDPLSIASIYISPSTNPNTAINDLEEIFCLGHSSILCGDYNAHHTSWGCVSNNQRDPETSSAKTKNFILPISTQKPLPPTRGCNPIGRRRFSQSTSKLLHFQATRSRLRLDRSSR
ncbi:putative RNA-directed DNA polymerase from transposon X-element [Trichonephila clavata]|uniref:Putative RNA-directed DNA polymerase from transposon X-element n=1 Tax=Trichonephila clavata TaxID=2740835 RepID=A0A8X6KW47_TRICU|nr:putative RNA-directed DNA polymerase from transposon X-element [Trichonephila clavata]